MTDRYSRVDWLPPLLVGASAAVAAEVALALLLYGGAGFVRSLTTILAVEGMALAVGLWGAPGEGSDLVDRLRRRWLFCLFAFVAAASFGIAWSIFPRVGDGALGQGVGLTVLAALPLYAAGGVLGGMAVVAGTDPGRRLRLPGASAALGAAAGFVLTGALLPRVPLPASLLLGCLVMLSLGGMLYGGVLAARTELRTLARRPGRGPDVRVEERRLPAEDLATLELWEGPFLRRRMVLDSGVPEAWEVALIRAFLGAGADSPSEAGFRVLSVGGGASALVGQLLRLHPTATIDVLERTAAVVELGREHFDTGLSVGGHDRCSVTLGNLDDAITARDGGYDLVIIDSDAMAPIGGLMGLSRMARRRLPALVGGGGVLVCGPDGSDLDPSTVPAGWRAARYRRPRSRDVGSVDMARDVALVLVRRGDESATPPALPGFKEVPVT
ncbi:MAG: hypothetical protein HKO77_05655 [Gemmatimonadetes bacterium]|nr:hypothetical protein [Gemmatimonadota bacterium]NNL30485.1 hypothetical protein [Gemmatimonadota bacterium]